MPRKAREDGDGAGESSSGAMPPKFVDGKPSILWFQAAFASLNDRMFNSVSDGGAIPFNYESAIRGLKAEMEALGLDPNAAADNRSPEEKLIAFIRDEMSGESDGGRVLEKAHEYLDGLEEAYRKLELLAHKVARQDASLAARMGSLGKAVARLIQRVRIIRAKTAKELPLRKFVPSDMNDPLGLQAYRASWPLRYMLYVMRNKERGGGRGVGAILNIAEFHVKIMWDTFKARYGLRGIAENGGFNEGVRKKRGIVVAACPGSGKSYLAAGLCGLVFSTQPGINSVYLHAVLEQSQRSLGFIKGMFDPGTDEGRRRAAVWPEVRLAATGNDAKQLTLHTGMAKKDPTMKAHGVMNAAKGCSTTLQVWDDIVPDTDLYSETERKQRSEVVGSTWQGRQRSTGDGHFIFCIANLVHPDDVVMRYLKRAKKGVIDWAWSIHPVGGPETNPPFFSIWPEVIPPSELRKRYMDMPNAALWQAAYQCNPTTALGRLVSAVGRYDQSGPEHEMFMRTATCHLSLDPAGTNRKHSDAAGFLYAAIGDITGVLEDGTRVTERRVRILDAMSLAANQTELVEHGLIFARNNRIDMIHVEVASGFHATADQFDSALAATGLTVNRLPPGTLSKEMRLRSCSSLIDAKPRMAGGAVRHVVEFPMPREGDATNDGPESLVRQLLDFGSIKDDHLVDSLTQLLNWAMKAGEVKAGEGKFTAAMKVVAPEPTRVQKWVSSLFQKKRPRFDQEEVSMMNRAGAL